MVSCHIYVYLFVLLALAHFATPIRMGDDVGSRRVHNRAVASLIARYPLGRRQSVVTLIHKSFILGSYSSINT